MKARFLVGVAAAVLTAVIGTSAAQAADNYVFLWNDKSDALEGITWQNGIIIQDVVVGVESYDSYYRFWNDGILAADVSLNVNILEADGSLSDTWQLYGTQGDNILMIPFHSDVEGQPLTPLPDAITMIETGQPQTVLQTVLTNGDTYTWQFVSDVPEPATWSMLLLGFGMLGLAMRGRRQSVAAAA